MRNLESAFERDRALSNELLDDQVRTTYLYAIRLAATTKWRTRDGIVVEKPECLRPFCDWLNGRMKAIAEYGWQFTEDVAVSSTGTRYYRGCWHRAKLNTNCRDVLEHLQNAVNLLSSTYPGLDVPTIRDALQTKRVALALGGGGGTGFVHQALFQTLENIGVVPAAITGTSIGALMGFLRSLSVQYDAATSILLMPGWWKILKSLRPGVNKTRHGQPAIWNFDFRTIISSFVSGFGWTDVPGFNELKIPFACVASGITKKTEIVRTFEPGGTGLLSSFINFTKIPWKTAFNHAAQIAHMLMAEKAVTEVVLGFDELTSTLDAGDAIPFSALVPGMLNYEIPKNHYKSIEILDRVFKKNGLYRLTDGGLASNVPVRALRQQINTLAFYNTNFHIIGVDVFAPQLNDGVFYPLEQVANINADVDAREASVFIRLKNLLSPMNLSPTLSQFKWLNIHFEKEFHDEIKVIQYVTRPLLPLEKILQINFS